MEGHQVDDLIETLKGIGDLLQKNLSDISQKLERIETTLEDQLAVISTRIR